MLYVLLGVPTVLVVWVLLSLRKLNKKPTMHGKRSRAVATQAKVLPSRETEVSRSSARVVGEVTVRKTSGRTQYEEPKMVKVGTEVLSETTSGNLIMTVARNDYAPNAAMQKLLDEEKKYRKQATALKKEKRFDEAVECLRKAREFEYKSGSYYGYQTLLRVPEYLMLAKRFKEAYDEAVEMANLKWPIAGMIGNTKDECTALLKTVAYETAYDAAVGMKDDILVKRIDETLKGLEGSIGRGRVSDIKREFQRFYDDNGYDIGRITDHCECLPKVVLQKWDKKYISVLGKTKELPSLDDAFNAGVFAADECCHYVENVFPDFDDELPNKIRKLIKTGTAS